MHSRETTVYMIWGSAVSSFWGNASACLEGVDMALPRDGTDTLASAARCEKDMNSATRVVGEALGFS